MNLCAKSVLFVDRPDDGIINENNNSKTTSHPLPQNNNLHDKASRSDLSSAPSTCHIGNS